MRDLLKPDLHLGRGLAPAPPATGRRELRDGRDWVSYSRLLEASASRVWRALTEPDEVATWLAPRRPSGGPAGGEAGAFSFAVEDEHVAAPSFRFRRVETGRLLALSMRDPVTGDAWQVEIELTTRAGGTRLLLSHDVVNAALAPSVAAACELYLDRLVAHLGEGDTGSLDYDEYFVGQVGHYRRMFPVQRR
jgi:uncharacterized protein YndB with AHSA1/START domain